MAQFNPSSSKHYRFDERLVQASSATNSGRSTPRHMSVSEILNPSLPTPQFQPPSWSIPPPSRSLPIPQFQPPSYSTPAPSRSLAQAPRPVSTTAVHDHSDNDWANGYEIRFSDEEISQILYHQRIVVTATTPAQVPVILSSNYGTVHPSGFAPSPAQEGFRAAAIPIPKQQMNNKLSGNILAASVQSTNARMANSAIASSRGHARRVSDRESNQPVSTPTGVESPRTPLPDEPLDRTSAGREERQVYKWKSMTQQRPKFKSASGFLKQAAPSTPSKNNHEGEVSLEQTSITTADDPTHESEDDKSAHEVESSRKRKVGGVADRKGEFPRKGSRTSNRTANLNQKPMGDTTVFAIRHEEDKELKKALKRMR
ncbi:hypothetical protein BKA64DRAFT_639837 [Cadophora sp. MPI-SDFR-AT-0126]|nr:hypothetical protein BKA64DRAFT_639837 [Leotiomycetes sp. MPI-SDFR-AT-0126]